ncbi:MAG: helix-turn-helix domain-containing protein [Verrucomicrobiota bacterium]|nr:helix-turn-helix domain-containing protein [Verrucomicrobiota bacterium]
MPVGQKLEEARKSKGVSLREVSESTKIRGDYLSAIESGNYAISLPEVYLRGFVRLYSKFLGLDQDAMVSELNLELGKSGEKNTKKSLGSLVAQENTVAKTKVGSSRVAPNQPHDSYPKSSVRNYTKPLIFTSIAFIVVLLVILGFNTFSGDKPQTEPNSNDNLIFESNKPDLPKVDLTSSYMLKISTTGPVDKLIICDEGKSPNVFHEFDSLVDGWNKEIPFEISFRCYSSNIEKVIFSVDGSEPSPMGLNKTGIGTYNWKPQQ